MPPLTEFFRDHHRAFLEPTTAADYEVQLRHFAKFLGREPTVGDLSLASVEGLVGWQLGRGRAKDTADKSRRSLLALWHRAAKLGHCAAPPEVKRHGRPTVRVPTAWTLEQFGRLLWAAGQLDGRVGPHRQSEWFSALLWMVYNSGWRIAATLAVERTWCDLAAGVVRIEPEVQKDDEGQIVTLLPETIAALRPLLAPRAAPPSHIFGDWPYADKNRRVLTKLLRRCLLRAELFESPDEITRRDLWHKLRRTFATQMYIATGDVELVRRMLGHSSIEVTYRYIDFSQVGHRSQADLLPRPQATRLRVLAGE